MTNNEPPLWTYEKIEKLMRGKWSGEERDSHVVSGIRFAEIDHAVKITKIILSELEAEIANLKAQLADENEIKGTIAWMADSGKQSPNYRLCQLVDTPTPQDTIPDAEYKTIQEVLMTAARMKRESAEWWGVGSERYPGLMEKVKRIDAALAWLISQKVGE